MIAVGEGRSVGEVGVGGGGWCWRRKKVRVRVSSQSNAVKCRCCGLVALHSELVKDLRVEVRVRTSE